VVNISSWRASSDGNGTHLEWKAGFQPRSLGFRIYREVSGKKVLVSPEVIAGPALLGGPRASLLAERAYSWWDIATSAGTRYWIEERNIDGSSAFYGPLTVVQSSGASSSASSRQYSPSLRSLTNAQQPRALITRPAMMMRAPLAANKALNLMSLKAVKLAISQDGWYRVPLSTLAANGLNAGKGNRLHLYAEGVEQALELRGGAVEFYGTALDTPSTATRVYWLVNGAVNKSPIANSTMIGPPSGATDFLDTVERRDRSIYFAAANAADGFDFFGDVVSSTPLHESITAAQLSRPDGAQLEVALQGVTAGAHNVTVALNGTVLGTISFADTGAGVATFPASAIVNGANAVALTATTDSDISLVDHVTLTYQRTYTADNDALEFTVAGGEQVVVNGFTNGSVRMVDISNPASPTELSVTAAGAGSFAATAPGSGTRTVFAFGADRIGTPDSIALHKPARLTPLGGRVDTILITTTDFMKAVQPLVKLRQSQKLHVKTFDIEAVYDAFNFGEKDPQAIKNFLAATQTAKHAPHYVLLVGDATYDPRNFLSGSTRSDLIPTRLINTSFFQAASDGWFADFNNTGETELAIGRLPGETADDVSAEVAKIIAYEKVAPGNSFLLASDASSATPTFAEASNTLVPLLPAGAPQTSITRAADNSNRAQLIDAINSSPDLINYVGHGNINIWGGSWISDDDIANFTNTAHPAFFTLMTCLNGYYIDVKLDSIAESLLRAKGGAVAVWASSGLTVPSGQILADQVLYQELFATTPAPRLGEAVRQAKNSSSDPDIRQTWNLIGDPETKLR